MRNSADDARELFRCRAPVLGGMPFIAFFCGRNPERNLQVPPRFAAGRRSAGTSRAGTRLSGGLAVALACILPVISCGGPSSSAENPPETTPADAGVFFPKQKPPEIAYDSLTRGRLVVDDEGCLRMQDQAGTTLPLWPPKYTLDTEGEEIRVRDAGGEMVAQVGERATLGGGVGTSIIRDDGLVDDRIEQELFERCPGNYFLVQRE